MFSMLRGFKTFLLLFIGLGYIIALDAGVLYDIWMSHHGCNGGPCGLWDDTVRKSPNKFRPYTQLTAALLDRGQKQAALNIYKRLEQKILSQAVTPQGIQDLVFLRANIINVLIKEKRLVEARQALERAMSFDSDFPGFTENRVAYYLAVNEPEKAIYVFEHELDYSKTYPNFEHSPAFFLNQAGAYAAVGRCTDLHRVFIKYIRTDPQFSKMGELECR